MRDCGKLLATFGPDSHSKRHERAIGAARDQKEAIGSLGLNDGSEGPIGIALLNDSIDPLPLFDGTRVGQQASMTESARPELGASLHPSYDAALRVAMVSQHTHRVPRQCPMYARRPALWLIDGERRSDRAAGIIGGGVNKDLVEALGRRDCRIHRAVVRHASAPANRRPAVNPE